MYHSNNSVKNKFLLRSPIRLYCIISSPVLLFRSPSLHISRCPRRTRWMRRRKTPTCWSALMVTRRSVMADSILRFYLLACRSALFITKDLNTSQIHTYFSEFRIERSIFPVHEQTDRRLGEGELTFPPVLLLSLPCKASKHRQWVVRWRRPPTRRWPRRRRRRTRDTAAAWNVRYIIWIYVST